MFLQHFRVLPVEHFKPSTTTAVRFGGGLSNIQAMPKSFTQWNKIAIQVYLFAAVDFSTITEIKEISCVDATKIFRLLYIFSIFLHLLITENGLTRHFY